MVDMHLIRNVSLYTLGLLGAALLIFGPRPQVDTRREGVVFIDYWEKWGGLEGSQMQQIVDEFNDTVGREKGIAVRYLSVSTVNQKTLVAISAGVPPDVAGMWADNIPQFAALGALEPLDDFASEYGITEDYYKPVYWEGCRFEDRLYALVSTPWVLALHWNKEAFEQSADRLRSAGLDPVRPPRTLDELDRYAAALDRVDDSGWVERIGYLPMHPGWWNAHLPIWFGGELYDEPTRTLQLNSPEVIHAFEWLRSYSEKLGVKSMTEFRSGLARTASSVDPFVVGTICMELQGPWRARFFEDKAPRLNQWKMSTEAARALPRERRRENYAWGATPFPSADGRNLVSFAGYDVLVIPRGARHKAEAFEFIAFVNRKDISEKLSSMHSKVSALRHPSEQFLENHPNPYIDVFEALASSPNVRTVPRIPIWQEVSQEMDFVGQKVFLLQQTPKEALDQAQERMQRKLDDFFELDAKRRPPDLVHPIGGA